jgi:peptidoglycan/LPS O-acetylase OafA/YrhL
MSGQIRPLTSLRFLAAGFVVFYHAFAMFTGGVRDKFVSHAFGMGFSGVSCFFVLSGFILSYVYLGGKDQVEQYSFWIARFARVYPLYCMA